MEIRIPELGESITEGTLSKWMVKVGDRVNQGDVLAEVETDKVNMEVVAEGGGTVRELRKREGDTVGIGEVIAVVDEGEEEALRGAEPDVAAVSGGTAGAGGTAVSGGLAGGATEPGGAAGGVTGAVGVSGTGGAAGEPGEHRGPAVAAVAQAAAPAAAETGAPFAPRPSSGEVSATPAARKYAREHGIDLTSLMWTEGHARVHVQDLQAMDAQPSSANAANAANAVAPGAPREAAPAAAAGAGAPPDKPVERLPMSRRRQTIARRLLQVKQETAMLTTFNEIDMSAVMALRNRRKDAFQARHGVKLGFMSFFTKAVVGALKAFPLLNAEIQGNDLLIKKYYDIGIAVSTDEGLVVPVVRDADRLGFAEIEREIASLADRARRGKLKLADLEGGTFTITNGGVFGSLLSTPILNPPQVGILGMHKIQTRPVALPDGGTANRPMMYVALSYDHRIVDGKEAVGFLVRVKELLEDPESLMLDV
jgi:2-oxoglutarate dehydrogenase E2 component (dihydrolipoamide succinyltransferase)